VSASCNHYGVPKQIGTNGLDDPASWSRWSTREAATATTRTKSTVSSLGRRPGWAWEPATTAGTLSWLAAEGADAEQTDGKIAAEACRLLRTHKDQPFFLASGSFARTRRTSRPRTTSRSMRPEADRLGPEPAGRPRGQAGSRVNRIPPHYGMDEEFAAHGHPGILRLGQLHGRTVRRGARRVGSSRPDGSHGRRLPQRPRLPSW